MKQVSFAVSPLMLAFVATAGVPGWRVPSVSPQGTATANMEISTTVPRRCVLTTNALGFGQYDPVSANATAPLDGQATLTVACTKGAAVTIGIDNGGNTTGQDRRMAGGTAEFLTYELYQDPEHTQRWGTAAGEALVGGVATSRDPRTFVVYGRIPGDQDVGQGSFLDTVLVTVDF